MYVNPYEVLGIPNLSDTATIENAYQDRIASFNKYSKLNSKQADLLDKIISAYNQLNSPFEKEQIDVQLKQSLSLSQTELAESMSSPDDDFIADEVVETKELSRDKTINVQGANTSTSPFMLFIFGVLLLFGVSFIYNTFFKPAPSPVKAAAPDPVVEAPVIMETPLIEADVSKTIDAVRYPSTNAFIDPQMIYAPNGIVFPITASVLGSLPMFGDGDNTMILKNPRDSAIFGRVVVRFHGLEETRVLRHFYIPSKGILPIFNLSSGTMQIQILTLSDPKAYVSPIFSIPNGPAQEVTQVADWQYAYPAAQLF